MAKTPPNRIFKLRYPSGYFSTGGKYPSCDERGKSWSHVGHIRSHLKQCACYPPGTEIVTFELVEVEAVSLDDIKADERRKAEAKEERRLERKRKADVGAAKAKETREKQELVRLLGIYGSDTP